MSVDVRAEVIRFMESRNPIPGKTESDKLNCRYLDDGVIDSLGIVEMIVAFEEKFDVHFESDDLQSLEFQSVGGLISIIERLRKAKA